MSERPGQRIEVTVERASERSSALDGTVIDFNEHVGLGHVEADDGTSYLFHCVEIADGSRSIEVGTAVRFDVMIKLGAPEASNLRSA